jgi:acyl-CoA thioester hydrolase
MSGDREGGDREGHDRAVGAGTGATGEYELVVGSLDLGDRHVDDDVFPRYVTEARERFLRDRLGDALEGYGWPVVHLEVDFHAELFAGDRVTASVAVVDLGTTSFTTEVELRRDGEPVASATTIQVTQDLGTGETVPVPEGWREELAP